MKKNIIVSISNETLEKLNKTKNETGVPKSQLLERAFLKEHFEGLI